MKRWLLVGWFLGTPVAAQVVTYAPAPPTAKKPWWIQNMVDQVSIKPYETLHPAPAPGSVPRGGIYEPQRTHEEGGKVLHNPLPATPEVVSHGRTLWMRACSPCHGDFRSPGKVPQFIPALTPPDLSSGLYKDTTFRPDGYIYEVIRQGGKALMPPYYYTLTPDERWAVIRYIRYVQQGGQP